MKVTSILAAFGLASAASAASLQRVNSFGANTSNAKMFIYVPDKLAEKPAIMYVDPLRSYLPPTRRHALTRRGEWENSVAIHYCTGSAQAYFTGSPYKGLADKNGFIVIYPESPYSGTCWDVSSKATLTHNGGANSNSIANMVTYTLDKYKGDATKVFVTGSSSGAMMTVSMLDTTSRLLTR